MKESKITVNYSEALLLAAALTHFLRNENIGPEDWPDADIDYLIGQLQEAAENSNRPTTVEGISNHCRKCKSVDHCIGHATNHPTDMIRCPCYGLLKLCVERSKENAED